MPCQKWHIQILRWHEGELDHEAEAALLKHLEACARCRTVAENFSQLDGFLLQSPEPPVPPFLSEKIVSRVVEEMRQDSLKGAFQPFAALFAHFRPVLLGIILALGIGLGVLMGLNLSHSINTTPAGSSYDVLALAGMEGGAGDSSLDFIWTDANGGGR
jgi:predicted anti-sigma-YlaC factor YlaD